MTFKVFSTAFIDGCGNVYVTGGSMGSGTSEGYATIKDGRGSFSDVNGDGMIDMGDVVFLIDYLY